MLPPIVPYDFGQQFTLVGFQGLVEQAAAIESVLTQHALTPAVDGGYSSLIHPLRSQLQPTGAEPPFVFGDFITKLCQQIIRLAITAKNCRRFH